MMCNVHQSQQRRKRGNCRTETVINSHITYCRVQKWLVNYPLVTYYASSYRCQMAPKLNDVFNNCHRCVDRCGRYHINVCLFIYLPLRIPLLTWYLITKLKPLPG